MGESAPMTPGQRARVLREGLGLSLSELSAKMGGKPSAQAIQQFETGGTEAPRTMTLRRMAQALQTTVEWIMDGPSATASDGENSERIEVFLRQQYRLSEGSIRKIADVVRAVLAEEELEALKERLARDGVNLSEQP